MEKPLCTRPWHSLMLRPNGGYRACCMQLTTFRPVPIPKNKKELLDVFDSDEFVNLRKKLLAHDLSGTLCEGCFHGSFEKDIPDSTSPQYPDLKGALDKGETKIGALPDELWLNMSHICNLKCIMCNQRQHGDGDLDLFPVGNMIELIDSVGIDTFSKIIIWGGEPFFSKDSVKFIDYLCNKAIDEHYETKICIISNCTELDLFTDKLRNIKNVELAISMDGFGEVYEAIRVGAKYEKVIANIMAYRSVSQSWPSTSLHYVVMSSNLHQLSKMLLFCDSIGIGKDMVSFTPVCCFPAQDFVHDPLLISHLNWMSLLDEAIGLAKSLEQNRACSDLKLIKNRILHSLEPISTKKIESNSRCAIYGTGSRGQEALARLTAFRPDVEVCCFLDTYQPTSENEGIPIVNINDFGKFKLVDHILIASTFSDEIEEIIKDKFDIKYSIYVNR